MSPLLLVVTPSRVPLLSVWLWSVRVRLVMLGALRPTTCPAASLVIEPKPNSPSSVLRLLVLDSEVQFS